MPERLWTATLTTAQIALWLKPPRSEAPFTVLERLTEIDFPASEEIIDAAAWEQGRIFGVQFELRWKREGNMYRVWLSGVLAAPNVDSERQLEGAEELIYLANTTGEADSCFLWGRDEVRVARAPNYRALPDGKGRPQLSLHNFRSPNGKLVFSRYTGMAWEEVS